MLVSPVVASTPASPSPRHSPLHPPRCLAHRPSPPRRPPGSRSVCPSPPHPPRRRQGFASRLHARLASHLQPDSPSARLAPRLCVRFAWTAPPPPGLHAGFASTPPCRIRRGFAPPLRARRAGALPSPSSPRPVRRGCSPRLRAQFASTPASPSPCQSPPHLPRRHPAPVLASASDSPGLRPLPLRLVRAWFALDSLAPPPPLVSPPPRHSHPRQPRCHIADPVASASGSPGPCCLPLRLVPMLRETGRARSARLRKI